MPVFIRNMNENDYAEFDSLMAKLHGIHVTARPDVYLPVPHIYSEDVFRNEIINPETHFALCAVSDGKIVGICTAEKRHRSMMKNMKTVYIDDIFVEESFRRRGIAKKLAEKVISEAKTFGAERVDLTVWEFNKSARELYEVLGFTTMRRVLEKKI